MLGSYALPSHSPYSPVMSIITFTHTTGEETAIDAASASELIRYGTGIHTSEPGSRIELLALCIETIASCLPKAPPAPAPQPISVYILGGVEPKPGLEGGDPWDWLRCTVSLRSSPSASAGIQG